MIANPATTNSVPIDKAAWLRDAVTRGRAALSAGDRFEASRWLDRAHRIAPGDATVTLLLASAVVGSDNARAATLFGEVLASGDVWDAWLGLATARFLLGDFSGARSALDGALGRHVSRPNAFGLADRVAREIDAPGWCRLTGEGVVVVHSAGQADVEVRLDGELAGIGPEVLLPPSWPRAGRVTVMVGEHHLIGSPLSLRSIGRVDSYAEAFDGGVRGWIWYPGDPDTDPRLSVHAGDETWEIVATDPADGIAHVAPLARPRSFTIPLAGLPMREFPVRLSGRDGRDLLGSPINAPWPERTNAAATPKMSRKGPPAVTRRTSLVIVISCDTGGAPSPCLEAISATVDPGVPIVLVNRTGEVRNRDPSHRFEGGIEAAIAAFPGHDVAILDAAALVPHGWLELLAEAAYADSDIGTVTPFSNRGVAAYPLPDGTDLDWFRDRFHTTARETTLWLDKLTRRSNRGKTVTIPSGGGPCLFIRGDCLAAVGTFRSNLFAQEAGVQEDFCARANAAGWRNVALTGLFVGYSAQLADDAIPGPSKSARHELIRSNRALLARLHPDFPADADRSADLLASARRRLDIERWRGDKRPAAILVTHDDGGGVERRIEAEIAAQQANSRRAVVLRPEQRQDGTACVVVDGDRFPNLRFELPGEQPALLRLLRGAKPTEAQLHHFLNHDPSIFRIIQALAIPYDAHTHDYTWFCPRIALVGLGDRYCGEPAQTACETCVATLGSYLHEEITVPALRDRSREILFGARQVIAPSRDAADRMVKHFPGLSVTVIPHENDDAVAEPPPIPLVEDTVRVCILGAIGLHKGFEVLLACALDAAQRDLKLTFVVAGTTIDDARLMDTGRVFVTGPYQPAEAVPLIRAQNAALAFLPSIWPETWCLALTELWCAGLRVAAFDIGAPAERIRRTGRGFLLPLGSPASAINDTLLERVSERSLLPIRQSSAYKAPR